MTNASEFIRIINELVYEAILHGGDIGGAYYSNEDDTVKKLNDLIAFFGLTEYGVESGNIPKIVKKQVRKAELLVDIMLVDVLHKAKEENNLRLAKLHREFVEFARANQPKMNYNYPHIEFENIMKDQICKLK